MGKTGPNKNNDSHVIELYLPFVRCIIFLFFFWSFSVKINDSTVFKLKWTQVPVLTNLNETFDRNHKKTENTSRCYRFFKIDLF